MKQPVETTFHFVTSVLRDIVIVTLVFVMAQFLIHVQINIPFISATYAVLHTKADLTSIDVTRFTVVLVIFFTRKKQLIHIVM